MSDNFIQFVDPAIQATLSRGAKLHADRALPKATRTQRKKDKERARTRQRVMLDIPERLTDEVTRMANENGVSTSGVAALALAFFVDDVASGRINITDYLTPARANPRFVNKVVLGDWENEA